MALIDDIKANEGFVNHVYKDSLGKDTIGYGFLVSALTNDELALNNYKLEPMSEKVANKILELKLKKLKDEVFKHFDWLKYKPLNVQEVIIEMCYQMGINSVSKFKNTLRLIEQGYYNEAYENGLKSLWARQTPKRAIKVLSRLLKA